MPADGDKRGEGLATRDGTGAAAGTDWTHWLGFLVSGLFAFATDATVLEIGIRLLELDPLVARVGAILVAMIVGWLSHRRLTFRVAAPPSSAEFARYAASASTAAILNWAVYAFLLIMSPSLPPLGAMTMSSVVAMLFSYISMRYAVFGRPG